MTTFWVLSLCLLVKQGCCFAPETVPVPHLSSEQCHSGAHEIRNAITKSVAEIIENILCEIPGCRLNSSSWNCIAFLNMSYPSQMCPREWSFSSHSVFRGCGRRAANAASCDSVVYSTRGLRYRSMCGYIKGYQYGDPNAFNSSVSGNVSLESWYIDGVSLTHGSPGARKLVWSFVNTWYDSNMATRNFRYTCPCTVESFFTWPHSVPEFVGNNYFCDSGNHSPSYPWPWGDNPLWDGAGCGGYGTCCQFNNPPWFCRTLPVATTDDLEVRMCSDQETSNQNTFIHKMELYVK